jgi:uncharacterized protein YkwD
VRLRSFRTSCVSVLLGCAIFCAGVINAAPASAQTLTEAKMARYINSARTHDGLRALRVSSSLTDLARRHSRSMAARGTIFHTSNLSGSLRSFSWRVAGENVGKGPVLYSLYQAFMKSPAHRDNILYSKYRTLGVGCVWSKRIVYCTQTFLG